MSENTGQRIAFGSNLDNWDLNLYIGRDIDICIPLMVKDRRCSQKLATQRCLTANFIPLPGYLMYNDGDSDTSGELGITEHIYQLMERAIKYGVKID